MARAKRGGQSEGSAIKGRPRRKPAFKPVTPVRIAEKVSSASSSQMTRADGPDAGTASYDAAPTPRKPPEPGGPLFPESHLTSSSTVSVAVNENEAPGSAAEYRYPRPSPQGIPPDVNPFRVSPQTQPGTFQQIVPSERWMTNMRIAFNSPAPGSTSMTVPVMVDQARLKSCVRQPLVVLCRYPTYNVAPPGFIEPSPVTNIIIELDNAIPFMLWNIEIITNDPGAVMIIGRDDLAQIEAHLGYPLRLQRNDNSGSSATRDVPVTSYGTRNNNYVGNTMGFPNQADLAADAHANALVQGQGQGLGQASHPSWSQAQDANQTAYFIPGYGIAGYHSSVDEPNTFLSNEGDAMVTTEQGFGELLQADEPLDNWHGWHDWSATQ